ncbi:MAG: NAD(P)/FAD-dependent oxidoreductase [Gemmatimonadota bacterium]
MKRILILGAGFGGLETATGLAGRLGEGYEITLVDRSDAFFIGFSKIDVLFGRAAPREVSVPYERLRADGVRFVRDTIEEIDTAGRVVRTSDHELPYDVLVVALGADLDPAAIPGFVESGGHEFYSMRGAEALGPVVREFSAGRLVLAIFRTPYKCPPAPYEVACQLDELFRARGVRDAIELAMVIPGVRPVPNPDVSDLLESRLADHGVELLADRPTESVDASARRLVTREGAVGYDLLVGVPVHVPPSVVARSAMSDGGFVAVDARTLETRVRGVYAIGDVTHVPAGDKVVPKAGAFAEDAARTVVGEILRKEGLAAERVPFRARGACYADLGDGEVARLDADFLGGDAPRMTVEGPSPALRDDRERFATSRRERWFR